MSRFLGFEFGASGPLHVRTERVALGLPQPVRLLYASDLHLGHRWTARVPDRLLEAVEPTRPDLILLGGDLADRVVALPLLCRLVAQLGELAPVLAVPGNHDDWLGVERVREAVRSAGGHWLPDELVVEPVQIDGTVRADARSSSAGQPGGRLRGLGCSAFTSPLAGEVAELLRNSAGGGSAPSHPLTHPPPAGPLCGRGDLPHKGGGEEPPRILCGHDPAIFPAAVAAGYDLMLAGHLHGGQCVWWERGGRQYPAAWFSRWHGLRFEEAGTVMLVSRGAADTFPVRFNCSREVILCELA